MGFRFFRRMKIAPGLSLNFSKTGISPSVGVPGARVTLGRQGVRKTVGIPGTGMFYTEVGGGSGNQSGGGSRGRASDRHDAPPPPPPEPEHNLDLGFFQRLVTPADERAFVDGCKAYVDGDKRNALHELKQASDRADAAFLAGFLALDADQLDDARQLLQRASSNHRSLGKLFEKYGLNLTIVLPITDTVAAHIQPGRRGALLGLAEVYQAKDDVKAALDCLKRLRRIAPDDVLVHLSIAELLTEAYPDNERLAKEIVELAGQVENDSSIHAALMLYKAQALRTLGLHTAARDELTVALRKRKDRDADLLRAVRYERARVYAQLGRKKQARKDLERIYAEVPDYEDVAERLNL